MLDIKDKQGLTAMSLIILMWKNWLEKVCRIHENGTHYFIFFVQNSDNPKLA